MIDSHAHIYSEKFADDREAMLQRAFNGGISKILMPNIDYDSIEGMLALEKAYPAQCFAMMGIHPCAVTTDYKQQLQEVSDWLEKRDFIAIGEIGLDYYWDKSLEKEQKLAFEAQLKLAEQYKLPIIIHTRDSIPDTLAILEKYPNVNGILHCFSGTEEEAQRAVELGYLLGFGGVVTFKKSHLPEVVENISLDNIVLETDAPYLAPTPNRGKRNEPSFLIHIAEKIADIKGVSVEEVAKVTNANLERLFGEILR
ncbi:MAG: TatD family hydrolase [Cyclobacteriaceae bacterium]